MSNKESHKRSWLKNIFTSGMNSNTKFEVLQEVIFMNIIFALGMVFLIPYGIYACIMGNYLLWVFDHVAALFLLLSALYLRKSNKIIIAKYFSLWVMSVLFIYLMIKQEMNPTGHLWTFTLPLFALFFLGGKRGIVAALSFIGVVVIFFIIDYPPTVYSLNFKIRYIGSFLAVLSIVFFYEYHRIKTQEKIKQKNVELHSAIKELQKTENALRQSERKYKNLIERASVGIVIIQDGVIKLNNSHILHLIGYNQDDIVNSQFINYISPDEREKFIENHLHSMEGEHIQGMFESSLTNRAGERVEVEFATSKISYNHKTAYLIFVRDITERKKALLDKEQLEEKLQQSQKMEAIGKLAGGIAHDFNNMLAGIHGFSVMIKNKFSLKNPKLEKYINSIITASEQAADLTAKLLAFARKGKFQMIMVDMHDTIMNVIKILEHTIDKRIKIETDFKAKFATVTGDPTQLQNVILNLAVNARDAMPEGGRLTFASEVVQIDKKFTKNLVHKVNPGTYLQISVADTGVGIDEKMKKRLFEPFFTTKRVGEGTGLGLASVYGTIKNHHGFIDVTSELSEGAMFKIFLMLAKKLKKTLPSVSDEFKPGKGHILIIDDEDLVREVAQEMLAYLGYTVETCKGGYDAIDYYKKNQNKIDLVITDITMPELSGYDCFRELKKINPNVKVLITSGYSIDRDARKLIKEGALGFIPKPFKLDQLSVTIFNVLQED